MKIDKKNLDHLKSIIDKSNHILIIQADNPDADSLASSIALEQIFYESGKQTTMYCGINLPSYLTYLEGWDRVEHELPNDFDVTIIVDTSSIDLLTKLSQSANYSKLMTKPCIVLDHHNEVKPSIDFANLEIINQAAATGELIYEISEKLNWELNSKARNAIVSSIMSDSLGLTTESTTARTIYIIAKLVEEGVKISELETRRRDYMRKSPSIVRYKGQLLQRVEYFHNDQIAIITIPWKEIEEYSHEYNPSMLVLDDMRLTENTDIAIAFKIYNDGHVTAKIKCNYGKAIANQLAERFGGGGHPYVSGFKITDGRPFDEIKQECIKLAISLLNNLEKKKA